MSERCERTSERRSKRPITLRVDFIVIKPDVYWFQVLDYESDPQPLLTDDEDLSDDDLHFQLGSSFDS